MVDAARERVYSERILNPAVWEGARLRAKSGPFLTRAWTDHSQPVPVWPVPAFFHLPCAVQSSIQKVLRYRPPRRARTGRPASSGLHGHL